MSVLAPLLRPASWRLSPGAGDVPWLRHLGLALLMASTLALLAWCGATWLEAWQHRNLNWASVLATPLCALGLRHAWRLGRGWLMPGVPLTLRWTGPVATLRSGEPCGGWRVDEWGAQPVDVSLVWDWQRVMLVRLRPWESGPHQAWVWLQDHRNPQPSPRGDVHRLRTLLCLPPTMTRPGGDLHPLPSGGVASTAAGLVASSRHESNSATSRMSRSRKPVRPLRQAPGSVDAPSSAPLRFEDGFPATQVLERWHDDLAELDGVHGGRP